MADVDVFFNIFLWIKTPWFFFSLPLGNSFGDRLKQEK